MERLQHMVTTKEIGKGHMKGYNFFLSCIAKQQMSHEGANSSFKCHEKNLFLFPYCKAKYRAAIKEM